MRGNTFSKVTGNLTVECIYQRYDQHGLAYLPRYLSAIYGMKITEANHKELKYEGKV